MTAKETSSVPDDSDAFDGVEPDAIERELGFAPAVAESADAPRERATRPARRRGGAARWRRRVAGAVVLFVALIGMGGAYALFNSASGATAPASAADVEEGHQLFQAQCITCHGGNLQGVVGRGPALVNVGGAAVYFQVSTGRMPLANQGAQADAKPPKYTEEQIEQLAAYVQTYGGGPAIPTGNLRDGSLAEGGELFRLNCAQCHGSTGRGAPLSAGKYAPSLYDATDTQIYTAMLSGPESMPVFSDNTITPQEKRSIVDYIQTLKAQKDPGGQGIARIGPVSEGLVIWIVGVGALMITILWIGAKA